MVAEADTGGRKPTGFNKTIIFAVSLAWALFQLWYASPLPYKLNFGVINDGQARIIHLSFAFLLAFATFPALKSSPRNRIPVTDWMLAALGVSAATYLLVFYSEISLRPGLPTHGRRRGLGDRRGAAARSGAARGRPGARHHRRA